MSFTNGNVMFASQHQVFWMVSHVTRRPFDAVCFAGAVSEAMHIYSPSVCPSNFPLREP